MIGALMSWLARSRHAPSSHPTTVLSHPPSVLVIGALFTSFFLVAAALSSKAATDGTIVALFFLGVALLSAFLLVDYFVTRFEILPQGLRFRSPMRGSGIALWHTVTQVSWSHIGKWFVIRLSSSRPVRVSAMLRGLPALAATLLQRLPRDTFDEKAHTLLEAATRGDLPRLW
jgi:hypothetical protein